MLELVVAEQDRLIKDLSEALKKTMSLLETTVACYEKSHEEAKRYKTALLHVRSELGIPQPDYPAPVASAVDIIETALGIKK